MLACTAALWAVPAKRGMWKTLKLADGTEVRATLKGDDMVRFYETEQGECFVINSDGKYVRADRTVLLAHAQQRREVFDKATRARAREMAPGSTGDVFEGEKKGLIILVQYPDKAFNAGHDNAFYQRVANEPGFTTEDGFTGSVKDYFKAQSMGKFAVDFDIFGPVTLAHEYAYYGRNAGFSGDAHAGEMIAEACLAADETLNFADYDWNGDGEVEQVFIVYAGLGEAAGGSENTIWPHKWSLAVSDYGQALMLDGVKVDTYACSCEMTRDNENGFKEVVDGIGTICHEFSHCLGYPDVYDTSTYGSNYGMDRWDLMDYGSYNNGGYTPSGYTAYEKWVAGWITPVELTSDTTVTNLQPLSKGGDAFIIYNSADKDEFMLFENRQQSGWDKAQPASGLIAMHVDYDQKAWDNNTVNNVRGHERCTIYPADNSKGNSIEDVAGDLFPFGEYNAFNSLSLIKPVWYNNDEGGHKTLGKSFTDIAVAEDGTLSFTFSATAKEREGFALLETFDDCSGMGGNDGYWFSQGGSPLASDNEGWTGVKHYAGSQCARFGTKSTPGSVTSPVFDVVKGSHLSCLAGQWEEEACTMTVSFIDSETAEETVLGTFEFQTGMWLKCELDLDFDGRGQLKFASSMRQFLDEVKVTKSPATGIENLRPEMAGKAGKVYSVDGRYMGTDVNRLGHGLYIVNGKKVMK